MRLNRVNPGLLNVRRGGRAVIPESFTHGSSTQRMEWLKRGCRQAMRTNVTHSLNSAAERPKLALAAMLAAVLATAGLALAQPALAQDDVTETDPSVGDVARTPLTDLNLRRDPIPEVLLRARAAPYSSRDITDCADIRREVGDLDAVLGDDFDTAPPDERGRSATGVAQTVVRFFIPFRGILREISGANSHEFQFREAIVAGLMRRAYLKGIGQEMECPYPARPAPPELVARLREQSEAEAEAEAESEEESEAEIEGGGKDGEQEVVATGEDGTKFVSDPVVQDAD